MPRWAHTQFWPRKVILMEENNQSWPKKVIRQDVTTEVLHLLEFSTATDEWS